jgi:alkylated DNA repair protein alkB family protein 1
MCDSKGSNNDCDDAFRREEKRIRQSYKLRSKTKKKQKNEKNIFDWNSIFNFHTLEENNFENKKRIIEISDLRSVDIGINDKHLHLNTDAKVYQIEGIAQGLFIVTNGLTLDSQLKWAKICIENYSCAEHTNLTNLQSQNNNNNNNNDDYNFKNLWNDTLLENDSTFSKFKPLRWASLGYHYDWTARMYRQNLKTEFPSELALLCKNITNVIGLDILAEAAIVNYYPHQTSMSGHLDDAEHNLNEPIVSISLGCPAIFLIGGNRKDIQPIPILLKSGDIIIMSGESRLVYHGIAIVLLHDDVKDNSNIFSNNTLQNNFHTDYHPIIKYLLNFRINVNVRRVTNEGGLWNEKCGSGAMNMKIQSMI